MKMANASFIRQFCKVLKKLKHAKLSPKKRRTLQKYKKELRQLINAKATISKQRRLLTQKGGGIIKSILSAIPVVVAFNVSVMQSQRKQRKRGMMEERLKAIYCDPKNPAGFYKSLK